MSGKAVRETLGFLAVVAGLVFVGLEIRQNTIAARAAAYQGMGAELSGMWLDASLNPVAASVMMRFHEDGSAEFNQVEEEALVTAIVGALRQYEATWRQVELGLLDPEALWMFGWNNQPQGFFANMQRYWPRVSAMMSPDFAAFMEASLEPTP